MKNERIIIEFLRISPEFIMLMREKFAPDGRFFEFLPYIFIKNTEDRISPELACQIREKCTK